MEVMIALPNSGATPERCLISVPDAFAAAVNQEAAMSDADVVAAALADSGVDNSHIASSTNLTAR